MTRIEWLEFILKTTIINLEKAINPNTVVTLSPYRYDPATIYTKDIAKIKCKLNQEIQKERNGSN